MRFTSRLTAAVLVWAMAALAQSGPGRRSARAHDSDAGEETVRVDAVVADSNGRSIPDLSAADFQILDDGKPEKVVSATYVAGGATASASLFSPFSAPAAVRRMVWLIDDLDLSAQGAADLRAVLSAFVDDSLETGVEVAIVRASSGTGVAQQFTSDKRLLHARIESVRPDLMRAIRDSSRERFFQAGTLGALRAALQGLAGFTGRKSVVLFSESVALENWMAAGSDAVQILSSLRAQANRSGVVFYLVNARASWAAYATLDSGLAALARNTGGTVSGKSEASAALKRALQDQSGYYLLAYHPDSPFAAGNLAVSVTRPGARVRARNGAMGDSEAEQESYFAISPDQLGAALRLPFSTGALPMSLTVLYHHRADAGAQLSALVHVDGRALTFLRTQDGLYRCGLQFLAAAFDESGIEQSRREVDVAPELQENDYRTAVRDGFDAILTLAAGAPGGRQVRVVAADEFGGATGSAREFIETPNFSSGDLLISGITLNGDGGARRAGRVFRVGESINYSYEIYNLLAGEDGSSQAELQSRLLHNGAEVFIGKPTEARFRPDGDPLHRAVSGRILPGNEFEPGEYVLEISVKDQLAPAGKTRASTQYARFEVR